MNVTLDTMYTVNLAIASTTFNYSKINFKYQVKSTNFFDKKISF